jgi:hypothetical protein
MFKQRKGTTTACAKERSMKLFDITSVEFDRLSIQGEARAVQATVARGQHASEKCIATLTCL